MLENLVLSDALIKVKLPYIQSILSDEGLSLETSAFQIFHGGNSAFINSFDKTKNIIFKFHSPTDAAPQFLWKLGCCQLCLANFT